MSDRAFLRMTELAAVSAPEGDAETRAVLSARKVLGAYTREVVQLAQGQEGDSLADPDPSATACPLRADEPTEGLPAGDALELAPERGNRLLHVPRVL